MIIGLLNKYSKNILDETVLLSSDEEFIQVDLLQNLDDTFSQFLEPSARVILLDIDCFNTEIKELIPYLIKLKANTNKPIIIFHLTNNISEQMKEVIKNGFEFIVYGDNLGIRKQRCTDCFNFKTTVTLQDDKPKLEDIKQKSTLNIKTIGVMGSQRRIGTTTIALQIATYFKSLGYKVAYIEADNSHNICSYPDMVEVKVDENIGLISLEDIDLYYNPLKISEIYAKNYDVYIFDFGEYKKENIFTFLDKDVKITVLGGKAWELPHNRNILETFNSYNDILYIFNFIEPNLQNILKGYMEEKSDKTYFTDYCPDMFSLCAAHNKIFKNIFSVSKKETKTKKGWWFKK